MEFCYYCGKEAFEKDISGNWFCSKCKVDKGWICDNDKITVYHGTKDNIVKIKKEGLSPSDRPIPGNIPEAGQKVVYFSLDKDEVKPFAEPNGHILEIEIPKEKLLSCSVIEQDEVLYRFLLKYPFIRASSKSLFTPINVCGENSENWKKIKDDYEKETNRDFYGDFVDLCSLEKIEPEQIKNIYKV